MEKIIITIEEIQERCRTIAKTLPPGANFYGVPRGGITPASILAGLTSGYLVGEAKKAIYIIDDLIDSGATRDRYNFHYPYAEFIALYEKDPEKKEWIVFPWEVSDQGADQSSEDIFIRLLQYIGEDPEREGLVETPKRMAKAWDFWTSGYQMDPKEIFKTFADGGENYDQMLVLDPIPFYSHCEHHLAAIFGDVYIAYIPNGRIAGLSKFARLVDVFARRLQVQERLTTQIAQVINDELKPLGVAVVVRARHFCIESRGVQKPGVKTTTSAMHGVFRVNPETRAEFLSLVRK